MKKLALYFLSLFIALTFANQTSVFASDDKVEISFTVEGNTINVNGTSFPTEPSYIENDCTFVPLRSIAEAIGADVSWKGEGKIVLEYRDNVIELNINNKDCTVNGEKKEMVAAPTLKGKTTMVPVRFIAENFGAEVSYDSDSNVVRIVLKDDGALKDLSFLTGGVNQSKVGNSYFGWSINVPKGSKTDTISFNQKRVSIENKSHEMVLYISAELDEGKTLEKHFEEMQSNPKKYSIDKPSDAKIITNANPHYIELLSNGNYRGASIQRSFIQNGYIYEINLNANEEATAQKIKDDEYFSTIINSFKLGYKGDDPNTKDLSTVKEGLIHFDENTTDKEDKKILMWGMDISPEWDTPSYSSYSSSSASFSTKRKENISVSMQLAKDGADASKFADEERAFCDENFNAKYYQFAEKKDIEIAGIKGVRNTYYTTTAAKKYTVDAYFFIVGKFLYNISVTCPEKIYNESKAQYEKMLSTFKPAEKSFESIEKILTDQQEEGDKFRIGKDDALCDYADSQYKWGLKIPGNWLKMPSYYSRDKTQTFSDGKSDLSVSVEVVENNSQNKDLNDKDKFSTIKSSEGEYYSEPDKKRAKLVKTDTITSKDAKVRTYLYRMLNEDQEEIGDLKVYVIDKEKYSYCFISNISDLFSAQKNLKILDGIWTSFNITGK